VYYISGETATEEREAIRHKAEKDQNAIILASFGTMSTGVNMPSIENIIFSSPSKSKIRNLQSIGRGLRLKEGKSSCNLYDISDNISNKSKSNHTLGHLAERIKIYTAEEFDMKIININL
jgi:superfamily II DNA or RNA helicase